MTAVVDALVLRHQMEICRRYGAAFSPPSMQSKLGIALNIRGGLLPINGLRHLPEVGTCGWYIWAGEVFEKRDDFFVPLHVSHIDDWHPGILRFLALPPGWRFLFAGDHVDVWFDEELLQIKPG